MLIHLLSKSYMKSMKHLSVGKHPALKTVADLLEKYEQCAISSAGFFIRGVPNRLMQRSGY